MNYRRLSFLIACELLMLIPIGFFTVRIIKGNKSYIAIIILLSAYFLYTLNFLRMEIIRIKKDKIEGIKENVLVLCNSTVLYKSIEKNNNLPPIPVLIFRMCDSDEYISLSGDTKNIYLKNGKKYLVRYYSNSELFVDISEYSKRKSLNRRFGNDLSKM